MLTMVLPCDAVDAHAQDAVLRAARVLDGTGTVMTNVDVTVRGGKIAIIRPSAGPLPDGAIDLRGRTLLPGLIDTHVHLGWYLNDQDRLHTADDGDPPATQALAQAGNA